MNELIGVEEIVRILKKYKLFILLFTVVCVVLSFLFTEKAVNSYKVETEFLIGTLAGETIDEYPFKAIKKITDKIAKEYNLKVTYDEKFKKPTILTIYFEKENTDSKLKIRYILDYYWFINRRVFLKSNSTFAVSSSMGDIYYLINKRFIMHHKKIYNSAVRKMDQIINKIEKYKTLNATHVKYLIDTNNHLTTIQTDRKLQVKGTGKKLKFLTLVFFTALFFSFFVSFVYNFNVQKKRK